MIFLVLTLSTGATVVAAGWLLATNARTSLRSYLEAQDLVRLERLAEFVEDRLRGYPSLERLLAREELPDLLRQFKDSEERPSRRRERQPEEKAGATRLDAPLWESFLQRVSIVGADGTILAAAMRPSLDVLERRAIRLGGIDVGVAQLSPREIPPILSAGLLKGQVGQIAAVALLLLAAQTICAWGFARFWIRPATDVTSALDLLSKGDMNVRLREARDDEIGDLVRKFNQLARNLHDVEVSRRRWIAEISHELRTPLTVLRGELEAVMAGVRPVGDRTFVSLREEVMTLSSLVEDLHLLALSNLEALPYKFSRVDALTLVEGLTDRFEARAAAKGLTLSLRIWPTAPIYARWDSQRIEQLLGNLVENSLRYTDPPGTIEITLRRRGRGLTILVDDSSPGVTPIEMLRMFDPLYRAEAARNRVAAGSGLGLAICRAIVHAHGGQISATDSVIGGLRVQVDLPIEAPL